MGAIDMSARPSAADKRRVARLRVPIDLLSAAVMATATLATAWSAYQSSLWNTKQSVHKTLSTTAVVRVGKLSNMALQRTALDVNLFVHWVSALDRGESGLAAFLFDRFPEPLKTAAGAWKSASQLETPEAPASPFEMPEYVLRERFEADRFEQIAQSESAAADNAGALANRYLLFTIIYASVLFFAGISGKFRRPAIDLTVLTLGALTLLIGVAVMLSAPRM
jgi:hypothetical protein